MTDPNTRPPLPPFSYEEAVVKTRKAEDAWNSRNPEAIALAYTEDSQWRNRADFPVGRAEIIAFLANKWQREQEYRLIKEVWAHSGNRIAVRFAYEWRDDGGQWYRSLYVANASHGLWFIGYRGGRSLLEAACSDFVCRAAPRLITYSEGYPEAACA